MPKGFHAIYLITKSKDLDKLIRSEVQPNFTLFKIRI